MRNTFERRVFVVLVAAAALFVGTDARCQILPSAPTTFWTAILFSPNNPTLPDPAQDQQTGSAESDIVGNAIIPSFYGIYDSGNVGFRIRVGADKNPPGFSNDAFVGLDANGDGSIDLFVGVDNSGSKDHIGIWAPGSGANNSPATTSIGSLLFSFSETSLNYNWQAVNAVSDPTATSYDLDGGGNPDEFLSFFVPFSDIVSGLNSAGITGFNTNSPVLYVVATATQPNSLNEDINGVNGGVNSSTTWNLLGAFTQTTLPTLQPVPEPGIPSIILLSMTVLASWKLIRKN